MTVFSEFDPITGLPRTGGSPDRPAGTPTDATIAAWAEGRLDPERASIVEAYLATHDDARAEAFALRDDLLATSAEGTGDTDAAGPGGRQGAAGAAIPSLDAARARRFAWVPFAAAAAVLLALGVATLGTGAHGPSIVDSDASLVAAAGSLAHDAPALFGDFRPVDSAERRAAMEDVNRAGLTILEPVGRVLDVRPAMHWTPSEWTGDAGYDVVIADADGAVVWRHSTAKPSVDSEGAPTLERGRSYLVEVKGSGPLGGTVTKAFDVAEAGIADALASGRATARRLLGDDLGDLAYAHGAVRKGFLVEAKRAARAYLARHPNDAAAREFDEYVRRRLGWPAPATAGPR